MKTQRFRQVGQTAVFVCVLALAACGGSDSPAPGTGIAGSAGPAGTPGANGLPGGTGASGTSVLTGAGAPAPALGNVGDVYFDSTAKVLIGPKTAAGWPAAGTTLTGANGTNGRTILSAGIDPVSADGANGDFFINTASSTLFGPKGGGGWPAGVSLIGPAGGAVAPQIVACAAGGSTVVLPAVTARTIFCNFNGGDAGASFTRVTLNLPAATSYASGTVITFRTTATTFSTPFSGLKGVPLQFFFQSASSTYTGYSTDTTNNRSNVATDTAIELANGEGALLSVMAVGSRWFQFSP